MNIALKDFNDFVGSFNADMLEGSSVISYVSQLDEFDFYSALKLAEQKPDNLFYYSIPEQNFYIIAAGEVLNFSFQSIEKLHQFSKSFSAIKNIMLHNYNKVNFYPPNFFYAAKFPSVKSSPEWEDFEPVKLFIPELILVKSEEKTYSVININPALVKDKTSLTEKFLSVAEKMNNTIPSFHFNNIKREIKLSKFEKFTDWQIKIKNILLRINAKEFDKVVLSRNMEFELSDSPGIAEIAFLLDKNYPECFNFIYKVNDALFFSASPEKLFIIKDGNIYTEALAGSIERGNDAKEDIHLETTLAKSSKDIDEHSFVIDHLKDVLEKYCTDIRIDETPSLKKLSNIQHLHTALSGTIKNGTDVFSIIQDIFPTPAVGGYPVDSTLKVIDEVEDFNRGLFTGFIGWMNLKNDGEFVVSIRSGLINKNKLYIYAGCGIVPGSDPKKEFEETQLKAEAIISLFNYENKS